ncbi:MAG: peptidyl-prolyl cis-trans isomerase [Acidobacteriota bacterium]
MRFRRRPSVALVLASIWAAVWGAACTRPPVTSSDVVLSIDGEVLPYSQYEDYLVRNVDRGDVDLEPAAMSLLFDRFVEEQLFLRLAIEGGLVEPDIDLRRAMAFLLRDVGREPSPEELDAYYRAHLSEYRRSERVRLRQILVHEREIADSALQALRSGEPFVEVAARLSQGPKAHLGGDQGVLARGDLPPKFTDLVFGLEPGESSDVLEADYGFQIFLVEARFPARVVPFEEALPDLRRQIERREVDKRVGQLLAAAQERYNVEVFPANLPFDYRGSYADANP